MPTTFGIWTDRWNVRAFKMQERAHVYSNIFNDPQICTYCGVVHFPYEELVKIVSDKSITVQDGDKMVSSQAPVSKLTVIPTKISDEFVIVFSMSHVAVDGHGYCGFLLLLCTLARETLKNYAKLTTETPLCKIARRYAAPLRM